MTQEIDKSPCDGCGRLIDARLLDAVMLDPEGNRCSEEAYCRACHPEHVTIPGDVWRPL